jgi:hypothetical protein
MKKALCLITLLLSANSYAEQLHNYEQIKSATAEGKNIRIFVDYSKCTTSSGQKVMPSYSGAYTPNEVTINNDAGYIAASLLHFTMNNPQFPSKPVYEFIRYSISNDNSVVLTETVLNPVDYSPLTNKFTLNCKIDESTRIFY